MTEETLMEKKEVESAQEVIAEESGNEATAKAQPDGKKQTEAASDQAQAAAAPADEEKQQEAAPEEASAPEETAEEEPPSLEEQLAAVKAEAAKNLDGWMRTQAEFANARKRFEKQRSSAYVNATADVVARLLPILDDFERALESVPPDIAEDSWYEGIKLVQRKLNSLLEHFNVTPLEAVGQPFDPNFHEALSQEPSEEYESGMVTRELQRGYKLGDRVIRPTLVYVAE